MKFMAGDQLSLADFWVGSWYCDTATHEAHPIYAMWGGILAKYPNLERWGKDFKMANSAWLSFRPAQPY